MVFVLVLVVLYLLISYIIYRFGFYTPNRSQLEALEHENKPDPDEDHKRVIQWAAKLEAKPRKMVEIQSYDGLRLRGRYYHAKDGAPLLIGFHGYRGTPSWDFSGGSTLYFERGFNVLLVEERGHCSSSGHTITFGVKERQDCLSWIRYAVNRFGDDVEIIIAGISMGAATVLMASELDLPKNVKGIIADCPFTSPREIIDKVTEVDLKVPAKVAYPFMWTAARLFGGFDLNGADASVTVRSTPVPILLIHGEADDFVPISMSEKIYRANPEMIEYHTFPGAGHGKSYVADRDRYRAIVTEFTQCILKEETRPLKT
ncbi:MAG: alpha/beta hydrolase [Oscillospiraceae bacterium]|nr:alpha/beta hydrolase [Oscillospiraceae bacterium]